MTIEEILSKTSHRPWNLPKESWKYYQEWNEVIFLHWQIDFEILRKIVHPDLEIELFDGKPWISIVAFNMVNIRPKYLPPFAPISNFLEINIRTYVKYKGKSGVYFLSIEAAKTISCKLANWLSELPYRKSAMSKKENNFNSKNTNLKESLNLNFAVDKKINTKSELDIWLTERYALFQDSKSHINEFEIHHVEWPINDIILNEVEINYQRFKNILNNSPMRQHYSPGIQVLAWGKKKFEFIS